MTEKNAKKSFLVPTKAVEDNNAHTDEIVQPISEEETASKAQESVQSIAQLQKTVKKDKKMKPLFMVPRTGCDDKKDVSSGAKKKKSISRGTKEENLPKKNKKNKEHLNSQQVKGKPMPDKEVSREADCKKGTKGKGNPLQSLSEEEYAEIFRSVLQQAENNCELTDTPSVINKNCCNDDNKSGKTDMDQRSYSAKVHEKEVESDNDDEDDHHDAKEDGDHDVKKETLENGENNDVEEAAPAAGGFDDAEGDAESVASEEVDDWDDRNDSIQEANETTPTTKTLPDAICDQKIKKKVEKQNKLKPKKLLFPVTASPPKKKKESLLKERNSGAKCKNSATEQEKSSECKEKKKIFFKEKNSVTKCKPSPAVDLGRKSEYEEEEEETGTWVQCSNMKCKKWRYVADIEDPLLVPDKWVCSMNSDKEHSSCDIAEAKYNERYHIYTRFTPGSVVWAKMDGYPWWPALVECDPDYEIYFEVSPDSQMLPATFHVSFFDDHVTRAWIKACWITPYVNDERPKTNMLKGRQSYKRELEVAIKNANRALQMNLQERLQTFGFEKRFSGKTGPWKSESYGKSRDKNKSKRSQGAASRKKKNIQFEDLKEKNFSETDALSQSDKGDISDDFLEELENMQVQAKSRRRSTSAKDKAKQNPGHLNKGNRNQIGKGNSSNSDANSCIPQADKSQTQAHSPSSSATTLKVKKPSYDPEVFTMEADTPVEHEAKLPTGHREKHKTDDTDSHEGEDDGVKEDDNQIKADQELPVEKKMSKQDNNKSKRKLQKTKYDSQVFTMEASTPVVEETSLPAEDGMEQRNDDTSSDSDDEDNVREKRKDDGDEEEENQIEPDQEAPSKQKISKQHKNKEENKTKKPKYDPEVFTMEADTPLEEEASLPTGEKKEGDTDSDGDVEVKRRDGRKGKGKNHTKPDQGFPVKNKASKTDNKMKNKAKKADVLKTQSTFGEASDIHTDGDGNKSETEDDDNEDDDHDTVILDESDDNKARSDKDGKVLAWKPKHGGEETKKDEKEGQNKEVIITDNVEDKTPKGNKKKKKSEKKRNDKESSQTEEVKVEGHEGEKMEVEHTDGNKDKTPKAHKRKRKIEDKVNDKDNNNISEKLEDEAKEVNKEVKHNDCDGDKTKGSKKKRKVDDKENESCTLNKIEEKNKEVNHTDCSEGKLPKGSKNKRKPSDKLNDKGNDQNDGEEKSFKLQKGTHKDENNHTHVSTVTEHETETVVRSGTTTSKKSKGDKQLKLRLNKLLSCHKDSPDVNVETPQKKHKISVEACDNGITKKPITVDESNRLAMAVKNQNVKSDGKYKDDDPQHHDGKKDMKKVDTTSEEKPGDETQDSDKENVDPDSETKVVKKRPGKQQKREKSSHIDIKNSKGKSTEEDNATLSMEVTVGELKSSEKEANEILTADQAGAVNIKKTKVKRGRGMVGHETKESTASKKQSKFAGLVPTPQLDSHIKDSSDRNVPGECKERKAIKKGNKKITCTSESEHHVPDIDNEVLNDYDSDMELHLSPYKDTDSKISLTGAREPNSSDEEEEQLDLGDIRVDATVPRKIFSDGESLDSDDDNMLDLESDDGSKKGDDGCKKAVVGKVSCEQEVRGRFGGKCYEHGDDSDPLELIED